MNAVQVQVLVLQNEDENNKSQEGVNTKCHSRRSVANFAGCWFWLRLSFYKIQENIIQICCVSFSQCSEHTAFVDETGLTSTTQKITVFSVERLEIEQVI